MQFTSSILLIVISFAVLLTATGTTEKEKEAAENIELKHVMKKNNLGAFSVSTDSAMKFKEYKEFLCLTKHKNEEFTDTYVRWNDVEFLNALQLFLFPTTDLSHPNTAFDHVGHLVPSNCTKMDDKKIRDKHEIITSDTLFDNFMYDMMTKKHIVNINI